MVLGLYWLRLSWNSIFIKSLGREQRPVNALPQRQLPPTPAWREVAQLKEHFVLKPRAQHLCWLRHTSQREGSPARRRLIQSLPARAACFLGSSACATSPTPNLLSKCPGKRSYGRFWPFLERRCGLAGIKLALCERASHTCKIHGR